MKQLHVQLDDIFRKLVKERANFVCECCKVSHQNTHDLIQCSHYISRSNWSIRWHPKNAFAHCWKCHRILGTHPDDMRDHAHGVFGRDITDYLHEIRRQPLSYDDEIALLESYQKQYKTMLEDRKYTEKRLEFCV